MKAYIEVIHQLVAVVPTQTWRELPYFPFKNNPHTGNAKVFDVLFLHSGAFGAVGFLWVEFEESLGSVMSFPFKLARHSEDADIAVLKPWSLREASGDPIFFSSWKNRFLGENFLQTENGSRFEVKNYPNNPFVLAINLNSETINTSVRVESVEEFKLFHSFELSKPQNQEVQMLECLDSQKIFNFFPKLHSVYSYSSDIVKNAHVAICTDYIENSGTLWKEFVSLNRALRTQHDPSGKIHLLANSLIRTRAETLGRMLGEFHSAMALEKGKNDSFLAVSNYGEEKEVWAQQLFSDLRQSVEYLFQNLSFFCKETFGFSFDTVRTENLEKCCKNIIKNFETRIHSCSNLGLLLRLHGNPHLGNVLVSGEHLYLVSYSASANNFNEKNKQSPLKDLACVINSLFYAMEFESLKDVGFDFLSPDSEIGKKLSEEFVALENIPLFLTRTTKHEILEVLQRFYSQSCRENAPSVDLLPPERYEFELLLNLHLFLRTIDESVLNLKNKNPKIKLDLKFLEVQCSECLNFFEFDFSVQADNSSDT
jgi:predicted trehalose synthase